MTLGERLLSLTLEYQKAVDAEEGVWDSLPGASVARSRETIAADYEAVIREMLATSPAS